MSSIDGQFLAMIKTTDGWSFKRSFFGGIHFFLTCQPISAWTKSCTSWCRTMSIHIVMLLVTYGYIYMVIYIPSTSILGCHCMRYIPVYPINYITIIYHHVHVMFLLCVDTHTNIHTLIIHIPIS